MENEIEQGECGYNGTWNSSRRFVVKLGLIDVLKGTTKFESRQYSKSINGQDDMTNE